VNLRLIEMLANIRYAGIYLVDELTAGKPAIG
jgi:hypothetical protein